MSSPLFDLDIFPQHEDSSEELGNKVIRMLFIILIVMWYYSYSSIEMGVMVLVGVIFIGILSTWITNKKEKFSPIPINMYMESSESIPQTSIQQLQLNQLNQSKLSPMQQIPTQQIPTQQIPTQQSHSKITPITSLSQKTIDVLTMKKETKELPSVWKGYQQQSAPQQKENKNYYTPDMGENLAMNKEKVIIPPRMMDPQFQMTETSSQVDSNPIQRLGGMGFQERERKRKPNMSMLLEPTTYDTAQPNTPNRMFLQDVQPNQYTYSNDRTPVNGNLGISSTPQFPTLSRQTIKGDDGQEYPLFARIDPELVRDDVDPERNKEMPQRGPWSESLPESNPLNTTTIYDPRFTGYGDSARAYYDSNLGNVRYYYTDVDSYRSPNFIVRNKVDHVDFIDPMDKVYSEYPRTASLDDVHDQVQDDWLAKSTEFREDIMEKLMRKNNAMSWQMRFAPKSKGARLATFTSGY